MRRTLATLIQIIEADPEAPGVQSPADLVEVVALSLVFWLARERRGYRGVRALQDAAELMADELIAIEIS